MRLVFGFAALLGVDFLQLLVPGILKRGIDALSNHTVTRAYLLELSLLILLIAAVVALLRFFWRTLIIGFSRLLEKELRERLFVHLVHMDQPFFGRWSTGSLMAHAGNDLSAIQMACGMGMVAAADALVMSTAAVCFMLVIDIRLTLLALLPLPLLALSTKILSKKMHVHFSRVQEKFGQLTEFSRNALVSIRLIKGYCLEGLQEQEFARIGQQYVRSNLRVAVIQGLLHPMAMLTGNVGMVLILYFGGRQVIAGRITLGDFVAFMTYLTMLIWPMMAIGWVANLAQRGLTSLRRIGALLQEQPVLTGGRGIIKSGADVPTIRCKQLHFSYPGRRHPALCNLTLQFTSGVYGITGRAGSGKSTLCRLIARLYPVKKGMLYVDGMDVNQLSIASVRAGISFVGQQVSLFEDSVYKNICFGRPDADQKQVKEAAKAAAIHDYISHLPDGYNSLVGERGVKFSGGQRQRIALARALLSNRPILIIDDGLSALDVATEQQVFEHIYQQYHDRLILLVSHRVNLLARADKIIMLDQGKIVAACAHKQMYAANNLYKIMVDKQQGHA
ncbi:MAG TPA: ABC transporter ATP-binding protein [Desulfobulbaceae bacterium]|nr:ABC transporter ATP-binding protein [Desulfobulbaceae bacterium]